MFMLVHVHVVADTALAITPSASRKHLIRLLLTILAITAMNVITLLFAHCLLASGLVHTQETLYIVGDYVEGAPPNPQFAPAIGLLQKVDCGVPGQGLVSSKLASYLSSPSTKLVQVPVSQCGSYNLSDLVSGLDWIGYNINYEGKNAVSMGVEIDQVGETESIITDRIVRLVDRRVTVSVVEGLWSNAPRGVYTVPIDRPPVAAKPAPDCSSDHEQKRTPPDNRMTDALIIVSGVGAGAALLVCLLAVIACLILLCLLRSRQRQRKLSRSYAESGGHASSPGIDLKPHHHPYSQPAMSVAWSLPRSSRTPQWPPESGAWPVPVNSIDPAYARSAPPPSPMSDRSCPSVRCQSESRYTNELFGARCPSDPGNTRACGVGNYGSSNEVNSMEHSSNTASTFVKDTIPDRKVTSQLSWERQRSW